MIKININDKLYPSNLRKIKDPPQFLYIEGNKNILNNFSVSVVGSRIHSEYGQKMCEKFTKELVEYNITIISGMAKGIDSIAHNTCIENGGTTIAVLPSGLNNIYPSENKELYYKIIDSGGTIISEYDPNSEYDKKKPIERNRIVSGLSIATLVVEAGYNSGSSITAKLAMQQGKNVFCIPSSLENRKGCTSNELIKKGGKLVTCIKDIIEQYPKLKKNISKTSNEIAKEQVEEVIVNEEYIDIYKIITEKSIHINEIYKKSKLSINEVNYKLMMLELEGNIIQLPGKNFIRK